MSDAKANDNLYQVPEADLQQGAEEWVFVGFWARVLASIIDNLLIFMIIIPVLFGIYGASYFLDESPVLIHGAADVILNFIFPIIAVLTFWFYKSSTPGKMVLNAKIVDANTGGRVPKGRLVVRYIGYFVSLLPLGLGFFWVGWDSRKQGWHDKMANTVVINTKRSHLPTS